MADKKAAAGVDNTARRTWDLDEYRGRAAAREEKASATAVGTKATADAAADAAAELRRQKRLERDPLHQGLIAHRSNLKARDRELDLESRLGKTQMVVAGASASAQAGYYCSVCDCTLRDSQSYLDHINGKYHNRALGMSMRAERSTAEQVRQRLREASEAAKAAGGKRRKVGGEGEGGVGGPGPSSSSLPRAPRGPGGALLLTGGEAPVPLRDGIARGAEEEEEEGAATGEDDDDDEDAAAAAGLLPPGAEPYVPDGFDRRVLEAQEREEREREARKRAKAEKKKAKQEEEGGGGGGGEGGGGLDPALAAVMGFGGFGGGGKKGR
jgi:U4/U6.U5 tri-snRNP component SNU23